MDYNSVEMLLKKQEQQLAAFKMENEALLSIQMNSSKKEGEIDNTKISYLPKQAEYLVSFIKVKKWNNKFYPDEHVNGRKMAAFLKLIEDRPIKKAGRPKKVQVFSYFLIEDY